MVKVLIGLAIGLFLILLVLYPNRSNSDLHYNSNYYNDVAAATYYAFNQLDCDSNNEPDAPCDDELQDINVGPSYVSVNQSKRGIVIVKLTINQTNEQQDHFIISFNQLGDLVNALETFTWPGES